MLPETYNHVFKEINSRTGQLVRGYQASIERANQQHREELNHLTIATLDYLRTGVAELSKYNQHISVQMHGTGWGQRGFSWKQYFRALAAEHKRPFVFTSVGWVYHGYGEKPTIHSGHYITMPKRRYLSPLMGLFNLVKGDMDGVKVEHNTQDTTVTLTGDQATVMYRQWLEMVTTEPECRKALRLL